jgi:toluene monooxygenase system ferredoxin subunit
MSEIMQLLRDLPLFKGLAPNDLSLLADLFQVESYPVGAVIFGQGDAANNLFVLLNGKVDIRFKPHDGEVLTVTVIERGGVFGWSSALGRQVYTSCAACIEDSEVLRIEGSQLRQLIETHPQTGIVILDRLAAVIAERLSNTHATVKTLLKAGMDSEREL